MTGWLRRFGPRLSSAVVLVAAGTGVPLLFPTVMSESRATIFQLVLTVSGVIALIRVGGGALKRIPDTLLTLAQP